MLNSQGGLVRDVLGLKIKTKPSSRRRQASQVTRRIRVLGYTFLAATSRQAANKEMLEDCSKVKVVIVILG